MDRIERLRKDMIVRVRELASNLLENKGIELVDVNYRREGSIMVLRLTVDKKGGVTVDECAWVNEKLGEILDRENFLIDTYTLEVCSPGLDRRLKTKKDFERIKGEAVRVATYGPVEDEREHIGRVVSCDDTHLTIELRQTRATRNIPLDKISKARLDIEF